MRNLTLEYLLDDVKDNVLCCAIINGYVELLYTILDLLPEVVTKLAAEDKRWGGHVEDMSTLVAEHAFKTELGFHYLMQKWQPDDHTKYARYSFTQAFVTQLHDAGTVRLLRYYGADKLDYDTTHLIQQAACAGLYETFMYCVNDLKMNPLHNYEIYLRNAAYHCFKSGSKDPGVAKRLALVRAFGLPGIEYDYKEPELNGTFVEHKAIKPSALGSDETLRLLPEVVPDGYLKLVMYFATRVHLGVHRKYVLLWALHNGNAELAMYVRFKTREKRSYNTLSYELRSPFARCRPSCDASPKCKCHADFDLPDETASHPADTGRCFGYRPQPLPIHIRQNYL